MCTYSDTAFPPGERRPSVKSAIMRQGVPFFSFVVFEPRIVNPPLPLVFMQNHPFIPRHACLAAISCLPTLPAALCLPFFPPSPPALPQVYFNNADVLSLSHGQTPRNLFVNFTATTRKSTSINARPVWPPSAHFFPLSLLRDFRIRSFLLLFFLTARTSRTGIWQRRGGRKRKGDDPHFSEVTPGCGQAG